MRLRVHYRQDTAHSCRAAGRSDPGTAHSKDCMYNNMNMKHNFSLRLIQALFPEPSLAVSHKLVDMYKTLHKSLFWESERVLESTLPLTRLTRCHSDLGKSLGVCYY